MTPAKRKKEKRRKIKRRLEGIFPLDFLAEVFTDLIGDDESLLILDEMTKWGYSVRESIYCWKTLKKYSGAFWTWAENEDYIVFFLFPLA